MLVMVVDGRYRMEHKDYREVSRIYINIGIYTFNTRKDVLRGKEKKKAPRERLGGPSKSSLAMYMYIHLDLLLLLMYKYIDMWRKI